MFGYTDGISFGGTNAEYKCLDENRLVKFSSEISFEQAAVLPVGGLTALHFLKKANVKAGHKVLINGASGSVGTFAVQLAKFFGAEVTGVCSSKNKPLVKSIGADHIIDYKKENFIQNNKKYDVIFDAVGKTTFNKCKNSLVKNGVYLTVEWPFIQAIWNVFFSSKKIIFGMAPHSLEDLIFLKTLVQNGNLTPVIDKSFSINQAVEAYLYVDAGHKAGNVILSIL